MTTDQKVVMDRLEYAIAGGADMALAFSQIRAHINAAIVERDALRAVVAALRAERDAAITAREAERAVVAAAVAMEAMVSVTEWSRDPNGYSTVTMREREGFDLHLALCRLLDAARAHATDAGGGA